MKVTLIFQKSKCVALIGISILNLGKGVCYAIVLVPVSLFTISCLLSKDQDLQLNMAKWFSLGFSFLMATVLVGIIMEGVNCPLAPSFLFFMALVGINVVAAILHFDFMTLFCGVIYFLFIPRIVFLFPRKGL